MGGRSLLGREMGTCASGMCLIRCPTQRPRPLWTRMGPLMRGSTTQGASSPSHHRSHPERRVGEVTESVLLQIEAIMAQARERRRRERLRGFPIAGLCRLLLAPRQASRGAVIDHIGATLGSSGSNGLRRFAPDRHVVKWDPPQRTVSEAAAHAGLAAEPQPPGIALDRALQRATFPGRTVLESRSDAVYRAVQQTHRLPAGDHA
jgi:hypothetical protein